MKKKTNNDNEVPVVIDGVRGIIFFRNENGKTVYEGISSTDNAPFTEKTRSNVYLGLEKNTFLPGMIASCGASFSNPLVLNSSALAKFSE